MWKVFYIQKICGWYSFCRSPVGGLLFVGSFLQETCRWSSKIEDLWRVILLPKDCGIYSAYMRPVEGLLSVEGMWNIVCLKKTCEGPIWKKIVKGILSTKVMWEAFILHGSSWWNLICGRSSIFRRFVGCILSIWDLWIIFYQQKTCERKACPLKVFFQQKIFIPYKICGRYFIYRRYMAGFVPTKKTADCIISI